MSAVTREHLVELIDVCEAYAIQYGGENDHAIHAALTRLLALEDALKEAGPALDRGAQQLQMDWDNGDGVCGDAEFSAQLRALAALGGGK